MILLAKWFLLIPLNSSLKLALIEYVSFRVQSGEVVVKFQLTPLMRLAGMLT